MMRGVMKISSSVLWSLTASRLNSQFRSGIRPRPGVRSFVVLLVAGVDAADDRRLAVADEHAS